ncbi:hypothetical protein FACS1894199_17810 [Bacteroidia bacterium]|nr:hypothetical protein FACS1894199_17810 [Bacteroidia bacterium]
MRKTNPPLPRPSENQVEHYLKQWDTQDNLVLSESSLTKLFHETYPKNVDKGDVLIKVCALKDIYGIFILSPLSVAQHIVKLNNIDTRLLQGDTTLVNELALIEIGGTKKNFYSFASKYCSRHNPQAYPIFDSFVKKVLMYFQKEDNFYTRTFKQEELKVYIKFIDILQHFKQYYKLDKYDFKQLDKYLWQVGREYFPNKY